MLLSESKRDEIGSNMKSFKELLHESTKLNENASFDDIARSAEVKYDPNNTLWAAYLRTKLNSNVDAHAQRKFFYLGLSHIVNFDELEDEVNDLAFDAMDDTTDMYGDQYVEVEEALQDAFFSGSSSRK